MLSAGLHTVMGDFHNILIDTLPDTINVDGRDFSINTDFRTGILFEMMSNDGEMSEKDIALMTLDLYFDGPIPANLEEAYSGILWFYRCGYDPPKTRTMDGQTSSDRSIEQRIFDYEIDAPLIYAAFMSQYNIDLQDIEYLHWWKFTAMFQGLHEDERICEIMGYRAIDLSKIEDKGLRNRYAALKSKYALPNHLSVEDKITRAGNVFAGAMMNDGQ